MCSSSIFSSFFSILRSIYSGLNFEKVNLLSVSLCLSFYALRSISIFGTSFFLMKPNMFKHSMSAFVFDYLSSTFITGSILEISIFYPYSFFSIKFSFSGDSLVWQMSFKVFNLLMRLFKVFSYFLLIGELSSSFSVFFPLCPTLYSSSIFFNPLSPESFSFYIKLELLSLKRLV